MSRELIEHGEVIDTDLVIVNRENRQRQGELKCEDLIESIRQHGLINPIVIDDKNVLVAGERRLEAFKALGYAEIPFKRSSQLTQLEFALLEFEENSKRKDLSWQDTALAVAAIASLSPELNENQLANLLGYSQGHVSTCLRVVSQWDNPKVASAGTIREALNFIDRNAKRAAVDALADLVAVSQEIFTNANNGNDRGRTQSRVGISSTPETKTEEIDNHVQVNLNKNPPSPQHDTLFSAARPNLATATVLPNNAPKNLLFRRAEDDVKHESFHDWIAKRTQKQDKFNFIHCDFPYGKNVHGDERQGEGRSTYGAKMGGVHYDDSPEIYFSLVEALAKNFDKIASMSTHLMFWYTEENRQETLRIFSQHVPDLKWWKFPLVWIKSDNKGIASDPRRGPRHIYETALVASRGDRQLVQSVADGYSGPTERSLHPATKPEPMLKHFFQMFIDEHSTVLDPTCGSGAALRAAESHGAKSVLGLEIDLEFFNNAKGALHKMRVLKAASGVKK